MTIVKNQLRAYFKRSRVSLKIVFILDLQQISIWNKLNLIVYMMIKYIVKPHAVWPSSVGNGR